MKLVVGLLIGIVVGFVGGCAVGVAISASNQQFALRVERTPQGIGVSGRLPAQLRVPSQGGGALPAPVFVSPSAQPAVEGPESGVYVNGVHQDGAQ
jgi:hypothetical protein